MPGEASPATVVARVLEFEGREIALDARGHLLDREAWSEALARHLAALDGIELSAAHVEVLWFLRDYHAEFGLAPPMRLLVKSLAMRLGADKAESRTLYRLFPQGPAKQGSRYAGLPRPLSCL